MEQGVVEMIVAGIIIFIAMLCVAIVWSSMIVAKQSDEREDEGNDLQSRKR